MEARGRIGPRVRRLVVALTLATLLLVPSPGPIEAAAAIPNDEGTGIDCHFQLGFKTLHDLIPTIVGDCLDDEHIDRASGDVHQETTQGLLVWRITDGLTAFIDGSHTWINGPYGLQERSNTQRFAWEVPSMAEIPMSAVKDVTGAPGREAASRITIFTFAGGAQYERFDVDGPDILFHRYYVSFLATPGSFGSHWTQEFDIRLILASPDGGRVVVQYPVGTTSTFIRNPDGSYTNADQGFFRLARDAGTGAFALTLNDDFVWKFDAGGLPTAEVAPDSSAFVATYNAAGRIAKIADTRTGHAVNLTYDPSSGRLTSVSDWHNPPRFVRYAYDERGRLRSVSDPDADAPCSSGMDPDGDVYVRRSQSVGNEHG